MTPTISPQWLSAEQNPIASAFYKRCGSKEKTKGDERVAVLRDGNNQIVAALRLSPRSGVWLLRALQVCPNHRRQGLALQLLDFVNDEIAQTIWCFPYPHLQSLYQQAGYRLVSEAPSSIYEPYLAYRRKQPLLLMSNAESDKRGQL